MYTVSFSYSELLGLALVFGLSLIPIVTATVLSFRNFRRGWWLAGPGALAATLIPAMGFILHATEGVGRSPSPAFTAVMALLFGTWIAAGLFLAVLALAGPRLPTLEVGEVFR